MKSNFKFNNKNNNYLKVQISLINSLSFKMGLIKIDKHLH